MRRCTRLVVDRAMPDSLLDLHADQTKVCVSHISDFSNTLRGLSWFNQDIGNWNVANVIDMSQMLSYATNFNQDIGNWNVSNVTNMSGMFRNTYYFNQDLSSWCVSQIPTKPILFDSYSALSSANLPLWGTCPSTSSAMISNNYPSSIQEVTNGNDIDFIQKSNTVTLIPNPASTNFRIEPQITDGHIAIINSRGEVLSKGPAKESYDIEGLPSGIYIVRIETNESIESLRLIVD